MNTSIFTEVLIIEHLIAGAIAMPVWKRKGGSGDQGFLVGAIFGILGVLILATVTPNKRHREHSGLASCPNCLEFIKQDARVCRYCLHDVAVVVRSHPAEVMSQ